MGEGPARGRDSVASVAGDRETLIFGGSASMAGCSSACPGRGTGSSFPCFAAAAADEDDADDDFAGAAAFFPDTCSPSSSSSSSCAVSRRTTGLDRAGCFGLGVASLDVSFLAAASLFPITPCCPPIRCGIGSFADPYLCRAGLCFFRAETWSVLCLLASRTAAAAAAGLGGLALAGANRNGYRNGNRGADISLSSFWRWKGWVLWEGHLYEQA